MSGDDPGLWRIYVKRMRERGCNEEKLEERLRALDCPRGSVPNLLTSPRLPSAAGCGIYILNMPEVRRCCTRPPRGRTTG